MKMNFGHVLLLAGVFLIAFAPSAPAHTDVTPQQARELIDSADGLVVVDVREPYEYCDEAGHIPGALNYPWNSGVLRAQYEELSMDVPILVVCRSGGRSNQAANFLDSKGFPEVYDMLGGMSSWLWETEPCFDPDEKYGGGTGEPDDPYLIYTPEQMNTIGAEPNDWDKDFKLMADIDLSGYSYERAVIAPDANVATWEFEGTFFTGVFDGDRRVISNLTITGNSYLGLFGKLGAGAEIMDLGVADVNITGSYYAIGGLVGDNDHGSITRSYSTGTITGYTHLGGLVGYNNNGDIAESYSTCEVSAAFSGNQKVGGLVGLNAGVITTSYSNSDVIGQRIVGGLVGYNIDIITMCYSTGMVTGEGLNLGGLVGENFPDYGIVTDCFWDVQTSGQTVSDGGEGNTTAEMMDPNMFIAVGWDFVGETDNGTDDTWWIDEGNDYPRLWWELIE